ncbi:Phycobilisome degradation protein nblA [Leptolyngbyaceae cyanobacterium JSC-12]|nr:Phycobilisome degradation protein nblA [Leptolyngbyaceae cyanobacterium JSC-12]
MTILYPDDHDQPNQPDLNEMRGDSCGGYTDRELAEKAKDLSMEQQFHYLNMCRQFRNASKEQLVGLLQDTLILCMARQNIISSMLLSGSPFLKEQVSDKL